MSWPSYWYAICCDAINPLVGFSKTSASTPLDGGCMSMHAGLVWPVAGQLRYAFSLALALGVATAAASAAAQATTGTMRGQVHDQQGAVVPGATVTVRNVDTNAIRTTMADDNGQFLVTNLSIGNYELTIELSGFTKYVRTGLTLAVNQDAVVNVTLQAGGVAETVQVTSDASIL